MAERKYDSTVARIAGNLLSGSPGMWTGNDDRMLKAAETAVKMARAIVLATKALEPEPEAT